MSDLHLEFGPLDLEPAGEDVLALAGDIGIFTSGLLWADEQSRRLGVPVVMIAGNHEFYQNRHKSGHSIASTLDALSEGAAKTNGRVTFLNRETAVVAGVRFLGATMWTDFNLFGNAPLAQSAASQRMNDYRCIDREAGRVFRPEDAADEQRKAVAFLAEKMHEPFDGPSVVMTHHAPSRRSVAGRYASDDLSPAYASNLDALVEASGAVLWQHGHVHHSFDYAIGATRVRTNPRGYYGYEINPDFAPDLVIDLPAQDVASNAG